MFSRRVREEKVLQIHSTVREWKRIEKKKREGGGDAKRQVQLWLYLEAKLDWNMNAIYVYF